MIKINLLKLLKERGMTQSELSEITGIRPSTICDMCNNNCAFLKLENIDKICSKLDCKLTVAGETPAIFAMVLMVTFILRSFWCSTSFFMMS